MFASNVLLTKSSIQMEPNLSFDCNGKVNCNDWELRSSGLFLREVENVLYPPEECPLSDVDIKLFDCIVSAPTAVLDLKHFIKCMDMQLKILGRYETYNENLSPNATDIDFYSIRCTVSQFVLYIRTYLNSIRWNYRLLQAANVDIDEQFNILFITMKHFFQRLYHIPDATFRYVPSKTGNECKQPEYHMYHMHIELRWFFVSLMYTKYLYCYCTEDTQLEEFENIQAMIINDFIYISLKMFEGMPLNDVQQRTPYNCTCIRELWLMLQIFTDNLSGRMKLKSFWEYVNEGMNKLLNGTLCDNEGACFIHCKNSELFCLWLIRNLSLLYGYNNDGVYLGSNCSRIRPNYEQLEKVLKAYILKGGKEGYRDEIDEELQIMIPLLNSIVTHWKQSRVSIVSLLWDCFHKRLDKPFLLQVSGPWTLSVEKKTAADILKQVKDRIGNAEYGKESSYGMFLRFLGSFLRENYSASDTKHWNQIKGRIYSKFSKSKVEEFSTSGVYNFISLFLTLAITADTTNVCSVMLDLLPQTKEYNSDNSKKYSLVWKGKLAILLLYNELKLSITNIASIYVDTVNTICCRKDDTSRSMMNGFVDVFSTILFLTDAELGEHLLVGGWIDRYLLECSNKMLGALINVLLNIFERCIYLVQNSNTDGARQMLDALWCYVACRTRQLVFNPTVTSDHYKDISKLAVAFTLEALKNPATARKHKHSAVSLFQHFASPVVVKDTRVMRYYLALILEHEQAVEDLRKEMKNFDTVLVQAWVKCSIIGHETNGEEVKVLQNYIANLPEIQDVFVAPDDIREFEDSAESILVFMMYSMKKRNTLKSEQERSRYDAKWRLYFNHIEKWILSPITEETKESELALWIYRCIGTLVLCTSPMLYSKNQSNNTLKVLLNKTILSVEQAFLKNLGKKTFSMIILGLEPLNVKSDISLQVLIRDLFDQYMTLLIVPSGSANSFKVSDSLLKCFKDATPDFIRLIFEILMTNFFTISSDNMMHRHAYLVMEILQNLLKAERNYASHIVEYIIVICTPYIIGCYVKVHDHHPHKQHTIDLIGSIVRNSYYKEHRSLRDQFRTTVSTTITKLFVTNQRNAFELLRSMVKTAADVVKSLSPQIESISVDLEKNLRPNAASFRYCWNQLRQLMKSGKHC